MALQYLAGGLISGLSTDVKPTLVPAGTRFIETDTTLFYLFDGTNWRVQNVVTNPITKKTSGFVGAGHTLSYYGHFVGNMTSIGVGGGGTNGTIIDSTGVASRWTTGGTTGGIGGGRATVGLYVERDLNPDTEWKVKMSSTAQNRFYIGYISSTTAPASSADPLANLHGVGFFYDSSVDANIHIMQNNGAASSDSTTIANVAAAGTAVRKFRLVADNANSKFKYSYDGGAFVDINTKIPAASQPLGFTWYVECLTNSAVTMTVYYIHCIQDA